MAERATTGPAMPRPTGDDWAGDDWAGDDWAGDDWAGDGWDRPWLDLGGGRRPNSTAKTGPLPQMARAD